MIPPARLIRWDGSATQVAHKTRHLLPVVIRNNNIKTEPQGKRN